MSSNNQTRDVRGELIDNDIATLGRIYPRMKACEQLWSSMTQKLGGTMTHWETVRDPRSGAFAGDPRLINMIPEVSSKHAGSVRVPAYNVQQLLQLYYDRMGTASSQETVLNTVADAVAYYVTTCLTSQECINGVDLYGSNDYNDVAQTGISFELCKKIHALFPTVDTAFVWMPRKDGSPYPEIVHRTAAICNGTTLAAIPAYAMSELVELHIKPHGWSYEQYDRVVDCKRQYRFTIHVPQKGMWPTDAQYSSPWVLAYVKADGLAMLLLSVWEKLHPESTEQQSESEEQ